MGFAKRSRISAIWAVVVCGVAFSLTASGQLTAIYWTNYAGSLAGCADGLGASALFNNVHGMAVGADGVLYAADRDNHVIRKITPVANPLRGSVTTLAGQPGKAGYAEGKGSQAQFNQPIGVAVDGAQNVYVADYANHAIRKIGGDGQVTLLAGTPGSAGFLDGWAVPMGNKFNHPCGVCVDSEGNVYVADQDNDAIRKINTSGPLASVSTVVQAATVTDSSGHTHRFAQPNALALAGSVETLYIAAGDASSSGAGLAGHAIYMTGPVFGGALKYFTPMGKSVGLANGPGAYFYTVQTSKGRVTRFDSKTASDLSNYGLASPSTITGFTIDGQGRMFIAGDNRLLRSVSLPAFKQAPDSQHVNVGTTVSWTVDIESELAYQLQWQKDGKDLPGATGAELTLKNVTKASLGVYQAVASNFLGTNTATMTLMVSDPPQIVTQPYDWTGVVGTNVYLSVKATGIQPLSYQWQKDGKNLPGATGATLRIYPAATSDSGLYTVIVSNSEGSTTSRTAVVKVLDPPRISVQPADQQVLAGSRVTLSVIATGASPLSYQWKKGGLDIYRATQASWALANAQGSDAGSYSVTIANLDGKLTSRAATLTVWEPPFVTSQPVNQSATVGGKAVFSVTVRGTLPLSYQWRKDGVDIVGAKGASFTLNNVQNSAAGFYSVNVTNKYGKAVSAAASLTIVVAPKIASQPKDQLVAVNSRAEFNVTATGTSPLFYQWQKDGVNIPDATRSTLVLDRVQKIFAGQYAVIVSNVGGKTTSNKARLTVADPVVITTQPQSQTVTAGNTATFTVTATGTPSLAYQWQKDGIDVLGARSATLRLYRIRAVDAGKYKVIVTNSVSKVTSSEATLTVKSTGPASIQPTTVSALPPISLTCERGQLLLVLAEDAVHLGPLVVESSWDLRQWTPCYTNATPQDQASIALPEPVDAQPRFYRVRWLEILPTPGLPQTQ